MHNLVDNQTALNMIHVHILFRNMKVSLICNQQKDEPDFVAKGEPVKLEYVSHLAK